MIKGYKNKFIVKIDSIQVMIYSESQCVGPLLSTGVSYTSNLVFTTPYSNPQCVCMLFNCIFPCRELPRFLQMF